MTQIPVIDLSAAFAGEPGALQDAALQLRHACEHVGFLYIQGHGVSERTIDDTLACAVIGPYAIDAPRGAYAATASRRNCVQLVLASSGLIDAKQTRE